MAKSNINTMVADSGSGGKAAYENKKVQDYLNAANLAKMQNVYGTASAPEAPTQSTALQTAGLTPIASNDDWAAANGYVKQDEVATQTAPSYDTSGINNIYQSMLADLQAQENARQAALEAKRNSALASLREAYDRNLSGLQSDSEAAKRQAYISYMLGKKNINQNLSNMGINGGAAESILANLYNTYGSNRAGIDKKYADAVNTLAAEYNNGVANIGTNYLDNYANLLSDQYNRMASAKQNYASDLISAMKAIKPTETTNTADSEATDEKLRKEEAANQKEARTTAVSTLSGLANNPQAAYRYLNNLNYTNEEKEMMLYEAGIDPVALMSAISQ